MNAVALQQQQWRCAFWLENTRLSFVVAEKEGEKK